MIDETIGVPNDNWPESPFGHGLDYDETEDIFGNDQFVLLEALWNWGTDPDTALPEYFDIGGES